MVEWFREGLIMEGLRGDGMSVGREVGWRVGGLLLERGRVARREMRSMRGCFCCDRGLRWLSRGCLESTKFSSSN